MQEKDFKEVNQSIGENPRFGPFSGAQFAIFGGACCIVFFVSNLLFGIDLFWSLTASIWVGLTCAILSGDEPHLYWSKVVLRVPKWFKGHVIYRSPVKKDRVGGRKVRVTRTKSVRGKAFEDALHLATMVRLGREGYRIGAYLLNKGEKKTNELNNLQFVFGFTCEGFHPLPRRAKEFTNFEENITLSANEFQFGEHYDFRWSSFADGSDAEEYLIDRIKNADSKENEFLDWSLLKKTQDLIAEKARNKISLKVYATYTVSEKKEENDRVERLILNLGTKLDRFIDKLSKFWRRRFSINNVEYSKKELTKILNRAQAEAVRHYQLLYKMGLNPVFQTEVELYHDLCTRLGTLPCEPSHVLVYDKYGLREEFADGTEGQYQNPLTQVLEQYHATSEALESVPFADRRWVCIQTPKGKKYVGAITLNKKPRGFKGDKGQLKFLWDILANSYDIEVHTQVSAADEGLTRSAQQMITRQNKTLERNVEAKNSVEVAAKINVNRSVEAQTRLYTGDRPLKLAIIILVYRDTPEELDTAIATICGLFPSPTKWKRELECTWLLWLHTLMVRHEYMLAHPFPRRPTIFASELSGFCCLVVPKQFDRQGFELTTHEGRSAVKFNLSKPLHTLISGDTGSGKSVFVAQILQHILALGMSVVLIDLPNPNGTGTFGDWTPYNNGFYYDISKKSNNLTEPPFVRNLTEQEQIEAWQAFKSDIDFVVQQLVLGSNPKDDFLTQTIESLIPSGTKAFYEDPEIMRRFEIGRLAPLGSPEHKNTPTLVDLRKYYTTKHIKWHVESQIIEDALNHIQLRLKYWEDSSIGNAICKPTSFRPENSKLITFALTDLKIAKHAEVLGMSAYLAATRLQIETAGVFAMDEASVLLKYDALSLLMGRRTATGRKAGSTSIVICQEVESVATSAAGLQIIGNMQRRWIGRIAPGAAESFSTRLNIPLELIEKNESFKPNLQKLYTLWLVDYDNTYAYCRYNPSLGILALTANNKKEQAARDEFKKRYPRNKFKMVSTFGNYLLEHMRQGKPL